MKSLIQKLVATPGPSGYEARVKDVVRVEIEPLVEDIQMDNLGNLIARIGKRSTNGHKIMLAAHLDEIGVIATYIDQSGFVRFIPVGGVRPENCVGACVHFLDGSTGIVGMENLKPDKGKPGFEHLFIDLGYNNHEDCPVRIGDMAVFQSSFVDMGKRLASKAMDDRIGVAVLIETMRFLSNPEIKSPHELLFVFTVQEEVGLRGATVAAYGLDPDIGLAVDVTRSGDTPNGIKMEVRLGKGPAIKIRDSGMLSDPRLVNWMIDTANHAKIPFQMEVLEAGSWCSIGLSFYTVSLYSHLLRNGGFG